MSITKAIDWSFDFYQISCLIFFTVCFDKQERGRQVVVQQDDQLENIICVPVMLQNCPQVVGGENDLLTLCCIPEILQSEWAPFCI
jgi:hypothetical protein